MNNNSTISTCDPFVRPIAHYLPHDAPMILIDRLVAVAEKTVHCQVDIDDHLLFFEPETQQIPAYVGIEFMAQTIAAWSGFHAQQKNQTSPIGFLLGCRRYHSDVAYFNQGQQLDIYAEQILQDQNMAVFHAEIKHQGELIASSQLNVYVPDQQQLQAIKTNTLSTKQSIKE